MPKELPKRKSPRLHEYDYSATGYYFVTICAEDKRCILGSVVPGLRNAPVGADAPNGPYTKLSDIGRVAEKYIQTMPGMDQYCITPNHIHMIVSIPSPAQDPTRPSSPAQTQAQTLSQRIRSFKVLVSKEVGRPVFQRSFYDHVIRNEEDYRRIWQYIDENPTKWTEDEYY